MDELDSYDDLGGDVGGVSTCVAGIIAAFDEGTAILQRIKTTRTARHDMPLPRILEDSICDAAAAINSEHLRGIVRYGEVFEAGDVAAVLALQKILIMLQGRLLNRLRDVEHGDGDVAALARAADASRDSTIMTLIALRKRLTNAEMLGQATSAVSNMSIASPVSPSANPPLSPPPQRPPPPPSSWHPSMATQPASAPPVPRKSSVRSPSYQFSSFGPDVRMPGIPQHNQAEYPQHDQHDTASTLSPHRTSSSTSSAATRSSSLYTIPTTAPIPTHDRSLSTSTVPSISSYPLNFTARNLHPTRENNYLGFCKAAWKLQNGDTKALSKAKDFTQSAQSKYHYLVCSKARCDFKGRGANVLTNAVITDVPRRLKYRWTFLARSHVFTRTSHEEQWSYLCMFCVFGGQQGVVMNLAALLDHVSREHRGGGLSDVLVDRTRCVQGRMCKDSESFDINLMPVDEEGEGRRQGVQQPQQQQQQQQQRDSGVYRPFEDKAFRGGEKVELDGRAWMERRVFELGDA